MNEDARPAAPVNPVLSRRNALIGVALACASGVAFARRPTVANKPVPEKLFESWVPTRFGPWQSVSRSGVVLPPPDTLRDRLYDNLLTRVFVAENLPPVMLLLAYNNMQDGVLQVHRPEVCYPVGGFQLSQTRHILFTADGASIPANIFTATGPNRIEQVAYFTRLGESFPRTWAEQRLAVVKANLAGDIPDGIMMRVSALGIDQGAAEIVLRNFSSNFIDHVNPRLQRLLIGVSA